MNGLYLTPPVKSSEPIANVGRACASIKREKPLTLALSPRGRGDWNARAVSIWMWPYEPLSVCRAISSSCEAIARISSVIFMLQYFGPHMLQKCALLKVSCGKV
ncbi:hypothetical protein Pan97_10150 [Bremerella volcania]|uniref:Uncharacterized protein n=1 Tax=Bremerella volcania TaxID=2527984 RepID=A0A518C470_9BACT|nr:hypothetical protein Pan97_10150 [Bremerella volcania]